MQGQRVGYIRVSSFDQNPDRQLEGASIARTFTDKASGKDTQRPELDRLLARNLDDLRRIVQGLTKRGVRIEFLKENRWFHTKSFLI